MNIIDNCNISTILSSLDKVVDKMRISLVDDDSYVLCVPMTMNVKSFNRMVRSFSIISSSRDVVNRNDGVALRLLDGEKSLLCKERSACGSL